MILHLSAQKATDLLKVKGTFLLLLYHYKNISTTSYILNH